MALNIFGQPPEYLSGLLGVDPEKLRKQATTTGLINTALAFAAQPRNQQYGSVLPYAAKALMAGQQGAQGVYQGALQDFQTKQKIEEIKRQQQKQQRVDELIGGIKDPNQRMLAEINTEKFVESQFKQPESPFAKINPKDFTEDSLKLFAQTGRYEDLKPAEQTTEAVRNYEYAKTRGYTGSFEDWAKSLSPYQLAQLGMTKQQLDLAKQEAQYKYGFPQAQIPQTATMQDVADTAKATNKTEQQVINDMKARGITIQGAR
jgi:hypothetical protein